MAPVCGGAYPGGEGPNAGETAGGGAPIMIVRFEFTTTFDPVNTQVP